MAMTAARPRRRHPAVTRRTSSPAAWTTSVSAILAVVRGSARAVELGDGQELRDVERLLEGGIRTIRLPNDARWSRVGAIVSVVRTPGLDLAPRRDGRYEVVSCTYVPGPSPSGLLQATQTEGPRIPVGGLCARTSSDARAGVHGPRAPSGAGMGDQDRTGAFARPGRPLAPTAAILGA